MSDVGTYYHSFGGYVVRDELVAIALYAGTPKEKFVEVRVTVISTERPKGDPNE